MHTLHCSPYPDSRSGKKGKFPNQTSDPFCGRAKLWGKVREKEEGKEKNQRKCYVLLHYIQSLCFEGEYCEYPGNVFVCMKTLSLKGELHDSVISTNNE